MMKKRPLTVIRLGDALYARPSLRDEVTDILEESRSGEFGTTQAPSAKRLQVALEKRQVAQSVIDDILVEGRSPSPKPKQSRLSRSESSVLIRDQDENQEVRVRLESASDEQFARMQTPEWSSGMQAAFGATPKQMGQAAVRQARKRKRSS